MPVVVDGGRWHGTTTLVRVYPDVMGEPRTLDVSGEGHRSPEQRRG